MLHTTISPAQTANAVQARAVARRAIAATKPSRLDRAIAAGDEALAEAQRLSDLHSDAEEAAIRWDDGLRAAADSARAMVLAPEKLCFEIAPSDHLERMTLEYGDGSSRESTFPNRGYVPTSRESLIKYCSEKGLKPKAYVAEWDAWQARREAAADAIMPATWHAAQKTFLEVEQQRDAALSRRGEAAIAILNAPVNTPAEAVRQIDAYCRVMEIKDLTFYADHEDTMMIAASLIKSLRRMSA